MDQATNNEPTPHVHVWAKVPASRFRGRSNPELEAQYAHGALVCVTCLEIQPARPGETKGLKNVLDVWAREAGFANEAARRQPHHGKGDGPTGINRLLDGQWSRNYDACQNPNCETPDAPHYGQGYCLRCYMRLVQVPRARARRLARKAAGRKVRR